MVTQFPLSFASCIEFRSVQVGLQRLVENLTETAEIALARIWLIQTGDLCETCRSEPKFHSVEQPCLHLVASAGRSQDSANPQVWNRLGGAFHRFPLDSQKIGRIAATGEPLLVHHAAGESVLARPDWLVQEGIQSFFGYPLAREDRVFGVMAIFSRLKLSERDLWYLRQIADGGARMLEDAARLSEQATRLQKLESANKYLQSDLEAARSPGPLVVNSPASRKLETQINMAAAHASPVLLTGERGTGKEMTARLIHFRSQRQAAPFVKIDGVSVTNDLLESFAAMGTLLINAIEQTPLDLQERLVHMPSLERGTLDHPAAARIMATSNVNLQSDVAAGRLRYDLYCALSVVEIEVPPLRQRREDLPLLAAEIVREICRRENCPVLELDRDAVARLSRYDWPGNVRELQLVLGCAVMQSCDGVMSLDGYLKSDMMPGTGEPDSTFVRAADLKQQERTNIIACLKRCHGKVYGPGGAAELLGVKPTTLLYRMKVLKIRKPSC